MKKIVFLVLSAFILLFIGCTTDKDLNSSSEKSTTAKLQDPVTIKPDVIVVGGGLAGCTAALRASELGARVVLFEQSDKLGGSANTAGGSISGAGFKMQKEAGIEDSPDKFYNDFITMGGGEKNLNKVIARKHAEESGNAIDWLQDYVGVKFNGKVDSGGYLTMNTNRVTYTAGGAASGGARYFLEAIYSKLDEFVKKGTTQLFVNSKVESLLFNKNKDVIGVVMNGKEYKAPSVIIATGGYGYSEKWLKEFNFTNITSNDPNTAIGSGYDFARSAGAALDNMDYCSCYGGSVPVSGFQASLRCNINYNGAIWVNTSGERLFNEPVASSMDKRTVWRTTDQNIVYIIVSEKMISDDKPLFSGMMSNSKPFDNKEKLNELLSEGKYAFKADTISELSKMINTKNLVNTVTKYNSDIASGKDTVFGRTKNLLTFDKGPYYAIYTVPYLMMTAGGPRINADGQLMRADGSKVGNCYLAGEIIGSANVAGHNTIGGIGHSLCTTLGRISAESAVKNSLVLKK